MIDTYYLTAFIISAILTGVYMFVWHKHYDVHITLLFALVPVVNLGFLLVSRSQSLEEAIIANVIAYIGGCYLQLMIMLAVFSLCHIHLNRWIKTAFFTLSTVVFLSTLTPGRRGLFYKSLSFTRENGLSVLHKEYGPMHHVFLGMVVLYFVLSWSAIFYALAKKKHCLYVDYTKALSAPDGSFVREYNKDDVHPTLAGYKVMEDVIQKVLIKLLK